MANAKCDITGNSFPVEKGFIVYDHDENQWLFCSKEGVDKRNNTYTFDPITQIRGQEDFIDSMAHLCRKSWFNPKDFFNFIDKTKKENGIRGG